MSISSSTVVKILIKLSCSVSHSMSTFILLGCMLY
jgi:hypothetical protein